MEIHPIELYGPWTKGYAMDKHVVSSVYTGDDEFGHPMFDSIRSPIGEMVYQLKYRMDYKMVREIMQLIAPFLDRWTHLKLVDVVTPVPPSKIQRKWQPVYKIAEAVARYINASFYTDIIHKINSKESKNMSFDEKAQRAGTIVLDKKAPRNYNILIVDDLYDSGNTLTDVVMALKTDPKVKNIYVLTMTKTKG